jgi:hypothetical protein
MSTTRPFKITINDKGERVAVDLTDAEIADAQQRTAAEAVERQAKERIQNREAILKNYLIRFAASQPDAPQELKDWADENTTEGSRNERKQQT